jgi:hypothetical protein
VSRVYTCCDSATAKKCRMLAHPGQSELSFSDIEISFPYQVTHKRRTEVGREPNMGKNSLQLFALLFKAGKFSVGHKTKTPIINPTLSMMSDYKLRNNLQLAHHLRRGMIRSFGPLYMDFLEVRSWSISMTLKVSQFGCLKWKRVPLG